MAGTMETAPAMSKWRQRLWPVYSNELKKFIPMVIMMFCILFIYTVVRNVKDTLLINEPHSSALVLTWVKILIVTPGSVLFVLLYAKLANVLSRNALYYSCLIPFIAFFAVFALWVYPNHKILHATPETVLAWQESLYPSIKNLAPAFGYWTFSLFYMMAELWGNIGVAVLFWQLANQITKTAEAKRFYPIFGFWSNLGLVAAGLLLKYAEPILDKVGGAAGNIEMVIDGKVKIIRDYSMHVNLFCGLVVLGGVLIGLTYAWMNKYVFTDPRYNVQEEKQKSKKPKLSISESFKVLTKSKYLGYITILVLSYGVVINLVEITWKDTVKQYYGTDKVSYQRFMADLYIYTGLITMVLIMFSQNIVRNLGWKFSANITPWISLISGSVFFAFILFKDYMVGLCSMIGTTPIFVAMQIGLFQNFLTKGCKYSLFDPTKEMAYLPLDAESKIKGKAAIDVVGGRAGKGGGSILNLVVKGILDPITKKFPAFTPALNSAAFSCIIGGIMVAFCFWWIWAIEKLSKEYQAAVAKENAAEGEKN